MTGDDPAEDDDPDRAEGGDPGDDDGPGDDPDGSDAGGPNGGDHDDDPDGFAPDPDRVETLRAVADDVRGDSSESRQVAAFLYRVSDLYDPDEETTPEEVYLNMRTILQVTERGGRDPDPEGLDDA